MKDEGRFFRVHHLSSIVPRIFVLFSMLYNICASRIYIPSGNCLCSLSLNSSGLTSSFKTTFASSPSLSSPNFKARLMLNLGCGLNPSVILSGNSARRIARINKRIRSRCEINRIVPFLVKTKSTLYINEQTTYGVQRTLPLV